MEICTNIINPTNKFQNQYYIHLKEILFLYQKEIDYFFLDCNFDCNYRMQLYIVTLDCKF